MANGDVASAAGLFTPVLSSADLRQGFDDINRLADAAARIGGADAAKWSLAAISVPVGWASVADPNINTVAPLAGGVRVDGGRLRGSWRQTYSGATVTAGATGNFTDFVIATLAVGYRPLAPRYGNFYIVGTTQGTCRINTNGTVELTDMYPGATLVSTNVVQLDFDVAL